MQRQPITFNKILFPVDFSTLSYKTAGFVREIANHYGAEVHLLHVVDSTVPAAWQLAAIQPETAAGFWLDVGLRAQTPAQAWLDHKEQAQQQLHDFLPEHWNTVQLRISVLEGEPSAQILAYAKEQKIDLIMMPTHGLGRFRRFLLGSVAAKVLHDAPCHVWTDAHFAEDPNQQSTVPQHILCAVDLSPHSVDLIAWTLEFAKQWNAEVRLVHAVPAAEHVPGQPDDNFTHFLVDDAKKNMEKLQRRLNLDLNSCVMGGDISAVIREAAIRNQADVIVLGKQEDHGYMGRLRAHGYNIVRDAPCPVVRM